MELGWDHWAVVGAPLVAIAGVIVYFLLRRHKEKRPDDHILNQ